MNRLVRGEPPSDINPLLAVQGKYDEADPLYLRAIKIGEKTLWPDHPDLAITLNNRAALLKSQVRAVRQFQHCFSGTRWDILVFNNRAGGVVEHTLIPPQFPLLALITLLLYFPWYSRGSTSRPTLYPRAIKIWEAALDPDHPGVDAGLNNRSWLLKKCCSAFLFSTSALKFDFMALLTASRANTRKLSHSMSVVWR